MNPKLRAEAIDVTIDRIDKINSPLVVIGLGGTGIGVVQEIKRVFAARYTQSEDANGRKVNRPSRTAYLCFDTSPMDAQTLESDEFVHLHVDGLAKMLEKGDGFTEYEKAWIDPDLMGSNPGSAAGTYRQLARFQLGRCYNQVESALNMAISTVLEGKKGEGPAGRLEIVIAAGICGGTGSGTFLDVPQIVRKICGTHEKAANITAYIVMPDGSLQENGLHPSTTTVFKANSYAALKELDFWQRVKEHKMPYSIQYNQSPSSRVDWVNPPYDHVVLISSENAKGMPLTNAKQESRKTIAENLLNYLAAEIITETDSKGEAQFSYISHEDNLNAMLKHQAVVTPNCYGYRAVGAFSMMLPREQLFAYEAHLLLDGLRIDNVCDIAGILPVRSLTTQKFVPNTWRLSRKSFDEDLKKLPSVKARADRFVAPLIPAVCGTNVGDEDALRPLREGAKGLHHNLNQNNWLTGRVHGLADDDCRKFLNEAWGWLTDYFKSILATREEGPFSLEAYLTDTTADGLMARLHERAEKVTGALRKSQRDAQEAFNACEAAWPDFQKPPMLRKRPSAESYLGALRNLYDARIREVFYNNIILSYKSLIRRVEILTADVIKPMCMDITMLANDFCDPESWKAGNDALLGVATLQPRMRDVWVESNGDYTVTNAYLTAMADAALKSHPSEDPDRAYIVFDYPENHEYNSYRILREQLDTCFRTVFDAQGDQSQLDIMMLRAAGSQAALDAHMAKMIDSLKNGATPLFKYTNELAEDIIEYAYLSLPHDSKQLRNFAQAQRGKLKITPKASKLTDRVYCLLTWDGIALTNYNMLGELYATYASVVDKKAQSGGLHLVRTRATNPAVQNDWSLLPDPAPYCFTSAAGKGGSYQQKEEFANYLRLTRRALDSGMLTIQENATPTFTVNLFYADGVSNAMPDSAKLMRDIQAVLDMEQQDGKRMTPDAYAKALAAIAQQARPEVFQAKCRPLRMAELCGYNVREVACDPFDQEKINAGWGEVELEEAKARYHEICVAFAAGMIQKNPYLSEKMVKQIEVFEKLAAAMAEVSDRPDLGKKYVARTAYAEDKVVGMLVHGLLFGLDEYQYGPHKDYVIQADKLPEDLAKEPSKLLRLCGYLTEVDSFAKNDLEKALANEEFYYNDEVKRSEIRLEKLERLLASSEKVKAAITKERDVLEHSLRMPDADVELLTLQSRLMQAMLAALQRKVDAYNRVMVGLVSAPAASAASVTPVAAGWTCAKCGNAGIPDDFAFCSKCGTAKPAPVAETADAWDCACGNSGIKADFMFCPKCGKPKPAPVAEDAWNCDGCGNSGIKADFMFCPKCGKPKPAPVAEDTWNCDGCGNSGIKADFKFCPKCGKPRQTAAQPTTWFCGRCGNRDIANEFMFCPKCGNPRA